MVQPLLATKLLVPTQNAALVSRHHLLEILDKSLVCKVTILSAPAGFGKTTLLGDWINQRNIQAAWLSLDDNDNDPIRFLSYFIKALQTISTDIGGTILEILQSPQATVNEPLLISLVNEIAISIPGETIFVIDDYHLVETPQINGIVYFLINHLPPPMHIFIASRSDPSMPVALLRGRGELNEIRQDDLRFSTEEAIEFLNGVKGLQLTDDQVGVLLTRTEGWISGLQMAAISIQGTENTSAFVQAFTSSNRYIFDYLIEEILNRQPENIREFLLNSSILGRLTGDLCDAVTNQTDSRDILDFLVRTNLFILPLDEDRQWYRYHHLFADLLQKQLMQKQPEFIRELHKRASIWFDEQGFSEEAITHALATKDFEYAAHVLEQNIPVMLERGEQLSLIAKFFSKLPGEFVSSRPYLSIQRIWGLVFSGLLDEAEEIFPAIEDQPGIDKNKEISGHIALVRALIANIRGDMELAIPLAQQADELLPEKDVVVRGMIPYILGNGYLEIGKLAKAEQAYDQIEQIANAANNLWAKTVAYHGLAQIKKLRGQLVEAKSLCEELLQIAADRKAERYGFLCGIYFELGDVLRESNKLDSARKIVSQGLELSESWEIPTDIVNGYVTLARIYMAQADMGAAADAIRKAKEATEKGNIFRIIQTKLGICQVQMWIQRGDLGEASHWADKIEAKLINLDQDKEIDFVSEMEFIALSRVWMATSTRGDKSNLEKSKHLLPRLASSAQKTGRFYRLMEILAIQSIVFDRLGDENKAIEILDRSISLAQPQGCMRIFLDEGQPMQSILERAQKLGIGLAYTKTLLGAFETQMGEMPGSISPVLPEPLSDREMEVLLLLPTRMTAAEMAEQLFIAKSTVDTHIKHIYSKLGVSRRIEAIQRAKELGFL